MEKQLHRVQNPNRLWYLTIKNLKVMFRDRIEWIWLLGYPFIFILLFAFAFGPGAFDIMAPAVILIGPLVLISQLASHFAEEKESGTMRRLATTPVSRGTLLLSGMTAQLVIGAFQIVLLFVLSVVFGAKIDPAANLGLLFVIPFLTCFTSLGFGLLLASLIKTANSAGVLAWFVILPLQIIGGLTTSEPLIAGFPTSFAVDAMRKVMTYGLCSFDAIGIDILGIIAWGLITTLIGVLLFQRKTALL
jgi:ABC-2 type transport system permease protein